MDRTGPDQHTNPRNGPELWERTGQIEAWLWVCFKAGAKSVRGELGSGYYTTYYIHNTRIYVVKSIDRDQVIIHRMSHLCYQILTYI